MIVQPFLKWPGGKRWVTSTLLQCFPQSYDRYYEPFLGGGAVFFALQPIRAVLSDINLELVNTYQEVRDNVEGVINKLSRLDISRELFHQLRSKKAVDKDEVAVRLIYLSKTAFNGMYRVNHHGEFNVPFGCKPNTRICDDQALKMASAVLSSASILHCDFEEALGDVSAGDLVYLDPPYTMSHSNNGFVRYNEAIFSWDDQRRLASTARRLAGRGAHVFVSNAAHESILALYPDFSVVELTRSSCISASSANRIPVKEYLFGPLDKL